MGEDRRGGQREEREGRKGEMWETGNRKQEGKEREKEAELKEG